MSDTYDLTWEGGSIEDAVVVRSDAAPGDAGIVGFEGLDQDGEPAFVLWTPDFDLQGWYDSVGGRASFYTGDQQPSYTHGYVCFAAEARVATPYGPMPVGALHPGHRVMTLDSGPQPLKWVGMAQMAGQGADAPLVFQPGAIGNCAPLRLSQQHRVMIRAPLAELLYGAAEVLVPAKALVGRPGVTIMPCARVSYAHLLLPEHHILFAEGAPCESLFVGPVAEDRLGRDLWLLPDGENSAIRHRRTARPVLSFREARLLMGLPLASASLRSLAFV